MSPDEIAREIVQKVICTNIHTGKEWLAEGYGYPDMLRKEIAAALSTERTAHPDFPDNWRELSPAVQKAMAQFWHAMFFREGEARDKAEAEVKRLTPDPRQIIGGGFVQLSDYDAMEARAEKAEAERDEWKLRAGNAEPWRLYDAAIARAEKAEAALGLAWQDGHHDGYADGCKAAREAALREAAEFIRVQRNETPATGEEFAVALLSLIPSRRGRAMAERQSMSPEEIAQRIVTEYAIKLGPVRFKDLTRAITRILSTERTAREQAEAEREIDYARIAASQVKAAREAMAKLELRLPTQDQTS